MQNADNANTHMRWSCDDERNTPHQKGKKVNCEHQHNRERERERENPSMCMSYKVFPLNNILSLSCAIFD